MPPSFVSSNHHPLPIGDWIIYSIYSSSFVGSHNCERIHSNKTKNWPCLFVLSYFLSFNSFHPVMVISCFRYSPSLSLVISIVPFFPLSLSHFLTFISYVSISSHSKTCFFFFNFQFHLRTKPSFFFSFFWTNPLLLL